MTLLEVNAATWRFVVELLAHRPMLCWQRRSTVNAMGPVDAADSAGHLFQRGSIGSQLACIVGVETLRDEPVQINGVAA